MILAALVLLGSRGVGGYTVTAVGKFYIGAVGSSQIKLNERDELSISSQQPINGATPDMIFRAYFWSKGKTTTISDQAVNHKRLIPSQLTDQGVVLGQVLDDHFKITNTFTWSAKTGLATKPFDEKQNVIGVSPYTGTAFRLAVDKGKTYLEFVRKAKVVASTEVGENFSIASFNRHDDIVASDDRNITGGGHAVLIVPGKQEMELRRPSLPAGTTASRGDTGALSINDKGYVAGIYQYMTTGGRVIDGVIWPPIGTPTRVAHSGLVRLVKINNQNQAVGSSGSPRSRHAVLYDSGGLHDLNSMVPKGTPTLAAAVAINDNGSIVCTGNDLEVFLLKPLAK